MSGSISGIGGGHEALRGYGQIGGTPLLGQSGPSAPTAKATPAVADQSNFSQELSESEGGANTLLAAWGAGASGQPPALAVQGVNPGAQAGFSMTGGQVGGLEPGAQAGGVLLGPVLRS